MINKISKISWCCYVLCWLTETVLHFPNLSPHLCTMDQDYRHPQAAFRPARRHFLALCVDKYSTECSCLKIFTTDINCMKINEINHQCFEYWKERMPWPLGKDFLGFLCMFLQHWKAFAVVILFFTSHQI